MKKPAFYNQANSHHVFMFPFHWHSLSHKCLALSDVTLHKPDDKYTCGWRYEQWCNHVVHTYLHTYIHTQERKLAHQNKTPPTKVPQGAEGGAEPHGRPQQETFGGYDCEFVEPPPSVLQTECPICSLILRDPYLTSCCGTHFCRTCSDRLQAEQKPCPTCREDNVELFANKSLKRSLAQLYVLCIHSKSGCTWRGELRELEHHLSEVVHSGELVQLEAGSIFSCSEYMSSEMLSQARDSHSG